MKKIVINGCFGGFGLSAKAYQYLGLEWDGYGYIENADFNITSDNYCEYRADPKLVECVETLGEEANGMCAQLRVVSIPDDVKWHIEEYDGIEHVAEDHRTWH